MASSRLQITKQPQRRRSIQRSDGRATTHYSEHQSNADPPLIAACMPRDVAFLAKEGLFKGPIVSYIFRSLGMYPVSKNKANYSSTKWAFNILHRNQSLCIFPESKRNPKSMQKGALGAAFLAVKSNALILPVGITGSENIGSI